MVCLDQRFDMIFGYVSQHKPRGDSMLSDADITKMNSLQWYHSIELAPGVWTSGYPWGPTIWEPIREQLGKVDFRGKRVLDVASWDGMWAFEAEKRGASYVVASDYLPARLSNEETGLETFNFAKRMLNSRVTFRQCSIYDIGKLGETFDIITCFGLLYHLRHPTLALDQCRLALEDGGLCLVESALIRDEVGSYIEVDNNKIYEDGTTWCAHTRRAMEITLESAYLRPDDFAELSVQRAEMKVGRGFWKARAFSGVHFHHFSAYPGLEKFYEPIPDVRDKLNIPGMTND
jgi:2-polyprenyl-3-methyl-5-hydroxy-6-metoxy-1,4-benzoquinol methylase